MQKQNVNIVMLGHLDHGKSTLIGRLLLETGTVPGQDVTDPAHLTDHLEEERERGSTLDTTQVVLEAPARNYTLIDAPGNIQLQRNMITGATQADGAVLVVDAAEGAMEQTRRHAYLARLIGMDTVLLAVNKMDLVDYSEKRFSDVKNEILKFLEDIDLNPVASVPVSARTGANVTSASAEMSWHEGPTLLAALDRLKPRIPSGRKPLRFPVQDVYEIDGEKVIVGRIASGMIREKQEVVICPSMNKTRINSIRIFGGTKKEAEAGENIGLTLDGSSSAKRGDVIAEKNDSPAPVTAVRASVFWVSDEPLRVGEPLTLRCATQQTGCAAESIHERMDTSTLEIIEADAIELTANEAAVVTFKTANPVIFESFSSLPELGRFVVEDRDIVRGVGLVTELP